MAFRIVTDSGADLTPELISALDVTVVPLHSVMKRGNETLDGTAIPVGQFYALLREKYSASTSAVNVAAFTEIFEPMLAAGEDVLYVGFSSGLSTTYHSAELAMDDLREKYPERKLYPVDTLAASLGEGMLVYLAAKRREAGASIDEVRDFLLETRLHQAHWFTVDDLFFLKRGGRVSAATALVGTALGIKPVMHVDDAGHLIKVDTARGRKKSISALLEEMKKTALSPEEQTVFISHGDCIEDAEYLAELIKQELGVKEVIIGYVGQVIGTHSGPGTLALFFLADHR